MRAIEAVARLDALLPNAYGTQMKLDWIAELEGMLSRELYEWHEAQAGAATATGGCACMGAEGCACKKRDFAQEESARGCACAHAAFAADSPLSVYEPYTGLYGDYLAAKIHYHDAEYTRYTNAMIRFNSAVAAYAADYTRRHRPKQAHKIHFGGEKACSCRPL